MTYEEAVNWLYTQLPMYQRIGAAAYKADLTNTIKLCNHFNDPQNNFRSIHVAGTNGKGSTSHMLAAVLQESGYKVGLYTSPHLKSFTERIRINGIEISEDFVTNFVDNNKEYFSSFDPSFFEITVAMAFDYFSSQRVDIAVIETGLGGRLDSTNIITPILSVITNIGLDHQQLLGDTLEKIAYEKAGIIKKSTPVIIGEYQPDIAHVFAEKADLEQAPIIFADKIWDVVEKKELNRDGDVLQRITYQKDAKKVDIETDQLGSYQEHNCKTVLVVLDELQKIGFENITEGARTSGFKNVTLLTGLKGRWQILQDNPLIIADTGHNFQGMEYIISQLQSYPTQQLRMVIGFVNDKNIDDVLQILPRNAIYYFTQASIPRAMPAKVLFDLGTAAGLMGKYFSDASEALSSAKTDSKQTDFIFIGGSTFVVAELI